MHDVAAKTERCLPYRSPAAQRDERADAERARQRSAAHQVTEPAAWTRRGAKQNSKISAGRHDRLR
jgi:hypothetical protein